MESLELTPRRDVKRRARVVALLALMVATACVSTARAAAASQRAANDTLYITHLDVGQGDATLITTAQGKRVLIDAGPVGGEVAARLRAAGIDTIDLLVSSHNHADHIGGMPDVLANFVVRAYLENGVPHTTATYRRTLFMLEREEGLVVLKDTARAIRVGALTLHVIPPPHLDAGQNDNSVGIVLEYGSFRALYTGDSEQKQLAHWLSRGAVSSVTLLKAAHHGAWNGATEEWIAATSPELVVISVGRGNGYGHPHPAIVRAWAAGARVYRTDVDGTVQVNALPNGTFTVKTFRDAASRRKP